MKHPFLGLDPLMRDLKGHAVIRGLGQYLASSSFYKDKDDPLR